MDTKKIEDEAYEIYQEGYECFHRILMVSPTGVKIYLNLEPGDEGYDVERGIACYKKAVEMGSPDAMFELGNCYHDGIGVEKDLTKAFMMYLQASAKGIASARINLARAYAYGLGVEPDRKEAISILEMEEKIGNSAVAQVNIGMIYAETCESTEDAELAIKWLEKASEQNNSTADEILGDCYSGVVMGDYFQPDYVKADFYLEKAIAASNTMAAYRLGVNIYLGKSQITDLDRAIELLEYAWKDNPDAYYALFSIYYNPDAGRFNPELALDYIRKAAEAGSVMAQEDLDEIEAEMQNGGISMGDAKLLQAKEQLTGIDYKEGFNTIQQMAQAGDAQAQYELGMIYYEGKILPMNKNIAYEWFDKAAAADNPDALHRIADIYYGGDGKELRAFNAPLAVEYYERAAKLGHGFSQYALANILSSGEHGVKRDGEKVFLWAQKAVENGVDDAVFLVGSCYAQGIGVRKDMVKAVEWIQKSADINNGGVSAVAQGVIGNWYLYGTNVSKDIDLAVKYLQMAVDNGNVDAKNDLATALKKKNKKGLFGLF